MDGPDHQGISIGVFSDQPLLQSLVAWCIVAEYHDYILAIGI